MYKKYLQILRLKLLVGRRNSQFKITGEVCHWSGFQAYLQFVT